MCFIKDYTFGIINERKTLESFWSNKYQKCVVNVATGALRMQPSVWYSKFGSYSTLIINYSDQWFNNDNNSVQ